MSYSKKKNSDFSSSLRPFLSCFFVKNESKFVKNSIQKGSSKPSICGPEATMISAAKHFSSAHKVRLIQLFLWGVFGMKNKKISRFFLFCNQTPKNISLSIKKWPEPHASFPACGSSVITSSDLRELADGSLSGDAPSSMSEPFHSLVT